MRHPWLLAWLIVIPEVCIQPMLRVYEQRTPWAMQEPYEQLLTTGRLEIEGCTIGLTEGADVQVPLQAITTFAQEYRKDQTRATLQGWLDTFLREGRVNLPGEIEVVREGGA